MPPRDAFPPEIAEIAERHAIGMRLDTWDQQIDGVLDRLAPLIARDADAEGTVREELPPVRERFRSIAARFYDSPMSERMAAAEEIAGIGGLLDLDEVLDFARSTDPAERVGAAVAIAAHLRASERLRDDPQVRSAVRQLLGDGRSRVRYRAAEVLRGFPALVPAYEAELTQLAERDSNEYVRRMARRALARVHGGS
jgi:HEAT repeat protein